MVRLEMLLSGSSVILEVLLARGRALDREDFDEVHTSGICGIQMVVIVSQTASRRVTERVAGVHICHVFQCYKDNRSCTFAQIKLT